MQADYILTPDQLALCSFLYTLSGICMGIAFGLLISVYWGNRRAAKAVVQTADQIIKESSRHGGTA